MELEEVQAEIQSIQHEIRNTIESLKWCTIEKMKTLLNEHHYILSLKLERMQQLEAQLIAQTKTHDTLPGAQ